MTSLMMKSSIPSSCGSTREERLAAGGPWWCSSWATWPVATEAASIALGLRPRRLGLDVLDRPVRRLLDALDELVRHPLRRALRQRRDHHLRDVEVLERVHRGRVDLGGRRILKK